MIISTSLSFQVLSRGDRRERGETRIHCLRVLLQVNKCNPTLYPFVTSTAPLLPAHFLVGHWRARRLASRRTSPFCPRSCPACRLSMAWYPFAECLVAQYPQGCCHKKMRFDALPANGCVVRSAMSVFLARARVVSCV